MMEIYMEEVNDLLDESSRRLRVRHLLHDAHLSILRSTHCKGSRECEGWIFLRRWAFESACQQLRRHQFTYG
jgi:hypothetical protein